MSSADYALCAILEEFSEQRYPQNIKKNVKVGNPLPKFNVGGGLLGTLCRVG